MILSRTRRVFCLGAALSTLLVLSGCGLQGTAGSSSNSAGPLVSGAALKGTVHGGQQPVVGSTMKLFAAGTSGYGTGATSLLGATVTTSDGTGVGITVTASSLDGAGTTATFTAANTLSATNVVDLTGFSGAGLFLNGQSVTVVTASSTQFTALVTNGTANANTGAGVTVLASGNDSNANAGNDYNTMSAGGFDFNFLVSNLPLYTCPSASSQIYMTATGGSPGGTGTNSALALMVALGSCGSLSSNTYISINEVTTVAAVTALQQFMSVNFTTPFSFGIGAPNTTHNGVATATIGLTNAFATAGVVASTTTGLSTAVASTGAGVPTTTPEFGRVYAEANVLATCVNSVDSSGLSAPCNTLFGDVHKDGSNNAPLDTVQAMYAMATNPVYQFSTVCGLGTPTPPFASATACASFKDFSIAIGYAPTYSGGSAVDSAWGIAVDAYGNVWFQDGNHTLFATFEIGPTGTLLTGPITAFSVGGTSHTVGKDHFLAIDQGNNVWVPNSTDAAFGGYVMVLTGSTATNGTTGDTSWNGTTGAIGYADDTNGSAVATPYAIIVDGSNDVYITNQAATVNAVSEFATAGSTFTETAANSTGTVPLGIIADTVTNGPIYVSASTACGNVGDIAEFATPITGGATATHIFATSTATCSSPSRTDSLAAVTATPLGMAIDKNDGIWLAGGLTPNGVITYLATDGSGGIGTGTNASVSLPSSSPSPAGTIKVAYYASVDGNNNAWIVNDSTSSTSGINELSAVPGTPITFTNVLGTGNALIHSEATGVLLASPRQIAIDPSGNIWITNSPSAGTTYITTIVGVAAPVLTPLTNQLRDTLTGQKP